MTDAIRLFRPSNGTDGELFHCDFCYRCVKFPIDAHAKHQCGIFLSSMAFDIDSKNYPREWRYVDDVPTCIAFRPRDQANADRRAKYQPRSDRRRRSVIATDAGQAELFQE